MNQCYANHERVSVALLGALASLLLAGCEAASTAEPKTPLSGEQILEKMVAAYRDAPTYADAGGLSFHGIIDGRESSDPMLPYSVTLERPNRLRQNQMGVMLTSDGEKVHAAIMDVENAAGLPGQVLKQDAPARLTASNYGDDEILRSALTWGLEEIGSPQIELLLSEQPFASEAEEMAAAKLIGEEKVDGRLCYRVEAARPGRTRNYWIDKQSFVLRRLDVAADSLKEKFDPGGAFSRVFARFEFQGATLDSKINPDAFRFEVPTGARRVNRFVPPVASPPDRVGESLEPYQFVDLEGKTVDRQSLGERIVVVDFWFTTCGYCRTLAPHLQDLHEKYKLNDRVALLAVNTDPVPGDDAADQGQGRVEGNQGQASISNEEVEQTFRSWGADLPIVRDPKQQTQETFRVVGQPTIFVLDADDKIHAYKMGYQPSGGPLLADIEKVVDRLLAGENVAQDVVDTHARLLKKFELELTRATVRDDSQWIEVLQTEIAKASEPQSHGLRKLWHCEKLKRPGNILVAPSSQGPPRIYVLDGARTVVELTADGSVVARHELPIPADALVDFLRTGIDAEGRRYFLASASHQKQLYLFDQEWRLKLTYPEGESARIADARLGDLDGDGALEMVVGYWGVVGVQGVSLTGQRLWSQRSIENVVRLAVADGGSDGQRRVLCASTKGTVLPVDHQGKEQAEIRVANRGVTDLAAADLDADGVSELCALVAVPDFEAKVEVVGLDPRGAETWKYVLPDGYFQTPIGRIVAAPLPDGQRGWLLPAADGSIHMLTKDGTLVDRFNSGEELKGLAAARLEGQTVILVAGADGLTAWQIESRSE